MNRRFHLVRLGMAIVAAAGSVAATFPQTAESNCRPFARTGHYVCDEFLHFYDTRGGLGIFGYPITEAEYDPMLGLHVQYFQRARMELHPLNPAAYRVELGLLVDQLGYSYPPVGSEQIPPFNSATHHYFPETQHVVSYAFLEYYREKGGLDIFGYPRSEFLSEDGFIVQYFQRARMEWHPEARAGSQIRLTNVGQEYVDRFGIETASRIAEPGELRVSASVQHAIIGRDEPQTVYVYVTNQDWEPVRGAVAAGVVRYPSGEQGCEFAPTGERGFTHCTFDLQSTPPGEKVLVDVRVAYGSLTATTQTFFVPWW
jgi:hypothetical protein